MKEERRSHLTLGYNLFLKRYYYQEPHLMLHLQTSHKPLKKAPIYTHFSGRRLIRIQSRVPHASGRDLLLDRNDGTGLQGDPDFFFVHDHFYLTRS